MIMTNRWSCQARRWFFPSRGTLKTGSSVREIPGSSRASSLRSCRILAIGTRFLGTGGSRLSNDASDRETAAYSGQQWHMTGGLRNAFASTASFPPPLESRWEVRPGISINGYPNTLPADTDVGMIDLGRYQSL